jgi:hypothetical protein
MTEMSRKHSLPDRWRNHNQRLYRLPVRKISVDPGCAFHFEVASNQAASLGFHGGGFHSDDRSVSAHLNRFLCFDAVGDVIFIGSLLEGAFRCSISRGLLARKCSRASASEGVFPEIMGGRPIISIVRICIIFITRFGDEPVWDGQTLPKLVTLHHRPLVRQGNRFGLVIISKNDHHASRITTSKRNEP